MGDVPRHRSRVQGGWAVNKNARSDRDKPKIPQAPRWLGKNIDIHPTNTRSSHTKGASCSSSSGSRTMGGGDTFIYEAPTEEIHLKQQTKTISKAGLYELSMHPTGVSRIRLFPHFLTRQRSDLLFDEFFHELPWRQKSDVTNGVSYLQPRMTAWFGDVPYAYSGIYHEPSQQWPPLLLRLRGELEEVTGQEFNSALVNLYRDHRDHLPWHSDNEPCLREQPVIASISLGEMRYFELRKQGEAEGDVVRIPLDSGTLLIMEGPLQEHWQHRVPKEYHDRRPRINVTFRMTYPE